MNSKTSYKENESLPLSIADIIAVIFSKIWVGVIVFLCVVAVASLFSFIYPPVYKVSGKLLVRGSLEKPLLFTDEASRIAQSNARVTQEMINTAINLITATDVLRRVASETEGVNMDDESEVRARVNQLRGSTSANPISLSNLIMVEFKGSDPDEITRDLNMLLDAFVLYNIEVQNFSSSAVPFFEDQTKGFKVKFDDLTEQLVERRLNGNVIAPIEQQENYLALVRDLERQKTGSMETLAMLSSRIAHSRAALMNINSRAEYVGLPAELLQSYPSLVEMEKTLAQLIINKQRAKNDFKSKTKQVRDANSQYSNMRKQIALFINNAIGDLKQQELVAKNNVDSINSRISRVQADSSMVAANKAKIELIEIEHDLVKENYKLYGKKLEEARINSEKDKELFSNISVVNRPSAPQTAAFPNRKMIIALSVPLGIILGLLAILICVNWERASARKRKPNPSSVFQSNSPVLASFETIT